ncbi:energy-coupling factor transporter ATP-binding protein EcfA2 [Arthrobacter sp. UYEF21]
MSEALVHIDGFKMDFGDKTVIRDLSFEVGRGETFGFLGSNGSGTTTTIRALLGIYQPTAGILHIDGKPFKPEDTGRLGYLPEERGLYKKEKVIDIMARRQDLVPGVPGTGRPGGQSQRPVGQALLRPAAEGPARRHDHEPNPSYRSWTNPRASTRSTGAC